MINYYTLLGVEPSASAAEIKAAFRRLVLLYHPDRNPDIKAAEKFSLVHKAYGILGDENLRRRHDMQLAYELPFAEDTQPVVYITERIWMKVSRRKVRVGETFSIIVRSFKRSREMTVDGVDGFEVVNYYSQVLTIQDRPVREILYVLRRNDPGVYVVGPARMRQGRYEYISGSYEVEVTDEPHTGLVKPSRRPLMYLLAAFIVFLTFNIGYYILVASKESEQEQQMLQMLKDAQRKNTSDKLSLPTGTSPYEAWFGKNFEQVEGNDILLKNGLALDAVVLLYDTVKHKPIGNYYLRAADSLWLKGIPLGVYQIKVFSWVVWDAESFVGRTGMRGRFAQERQYYILKGDSATIVFNRQNLFTSRKLNINPTNTPGSRAEIIEMNQFLQK